MLELIALTAVFLIGLYLHDRARERAHQAERDQWHHERQVLLNRIKPETAQYTGEDVEVKLAVAPDSDEDYWEAVEERSR